MQTSTLRQILSFLTGRRSGEEDMKSLIAEMKKDLKDIKAQLSGDTVLPTIPEVVVEPESEPHPKKYARVGFKGSRLRCPPKPIQRSESISPK